ncbi:hypothetical protein PUN28_018342 [Cardiocondyla obscurior]|uniref:Uncharacterized protein n=1 Tax=Cardiocondyla obscurior TaxID=286306 RepID=A0AAW2EJ49_9HYME
MKMKSVSVENLGNILKQMVNTALKDSNQIAKLYQAIYEDWYLKKMIELEDATSKINNVKVNKKIEQTIIGAKNGEKTCLKVSEDEKYINNDSNLPNQVVIEICNSTITQKAKIKKKLQYNTTNQNRNQNKEKLFKPVKRRLSFESWKKEKSLTYRKSLKETEEKKQQELQKKLKNTEYRKASQKPTLTLVARNESNEKTNLQKKINERLITNDHAFNDWKKQREMKQKPNSLTYMQK